ncbi:MAG: cysteine desulfurase [Gammaproteobacteria bacterium]|nr:cysteine desulfurase [Gammaproteobacteria bacterium]
MTACAQQTAAPGKSIAQLRADFPILAQRVHNHPLVYLDNAATTQKPQVVIDAIADYYTYDNANVHRGIHTLSERATAAYEGAREKVRAFLNAASTAEIIYTRGTTEAINLVAQSWGRNQLQAGDEILITALEHHANIVPWQLLCQQTGAVLKVAPVLEDGTLDPAAFAELLGPRTRLAALVHVSNALGTINPIADMVAQAKAAGALVLVDGAQAVAHEPVDVSALGCDFYAFSGHKIYAPTGIGILYGREALLDEMPPWQGGGDMIRTVSFEHTEYADLPWKFEAGTPHIAGAIGLGAALDYFRALDQAALAAHEQSLLAALTGGLTGIPGLRIIGTAPNKVAVVSFVIEGAHQADIGKLLDSLGIAVRVGHHCAMPALKRFGVTGTVRASCALYNTVEEIERFAGAVTRVREMLL